MCKDCDFEIRKVKEDEADLMAMLNVPPFR